PGITLPDRVGERSFPKMVVPGRLDAGLRHQGVEVLELLIDGLFVQGRIEDIDHLVRTGHDTFLWSGRPGPGAGAGEEDCETEKYSPDGDPAVAPPQRRRVRRETGSGAAGDRWTEPSARLIMASRRTRRVPIPARTGGPVRKVPTSGRGPIMPTAAKSPEARRAAARPRAGASP